MAIAKLRPIVEQDLDETAWLALYHLHSHAAPALANATTADEHLPLAAIPKTQSPSTGPGDLHFVGWESGA
jgi:hypothetical protein